MLNVNFEHPFDQLRKLALSLGGDFVEYQDSALLTLDNAIGKGRVTSFNLFSGLSVRIFDITFKEDIDINRTDNDPSSIHFLYCLKGHFYHKFSDQEEHTKIYPRQNVIFSSSPKSTSIVTFPANTYIKLTAIFVHDNLQITSAKRRTALESSLQDITSFVERDEPFNYYGEISPLTSKYAKILMDNVRTDAVGKLLVEAAVINTLASQVDHHDADKGDVKIGFPISNTEILKTSEVAEYIADNIDQTLNIGYLSKTFGLSPKKLQAGFRILFGESLGNFITHLRLEKGKELLQHTDLTISEVCYKVGFSSRSYFSKTFAERFGLLPSKFKNSLSSDDLIYELTYKSTMSSTLQLEDIENIIDEATTTNLKYNITGCLVCQENNFFQLLEGSKSNVLHIYDKIKKDKRHHDLEIITRKINSHRFFPKWSMALLSDRDKMEHTFKNRAINLDIDTSSILKGDNVNVNSAVFWRRVLNTIKVSKS